MVGLSFLLHPLLVLRCRLGLDLVGFNHEDLLVRVEKFFVIITIIKVGKDLLIGLLALKVLKDLSYMHLELFDVGCQRFLTDTAFILERVNQPQTFVGKRFLLVDLILDFIKILQG